MKSIMTNDPYRHNGLSKDRAIDLIIDIFVRVIGFIEKREVSKDTNAARDFRIHTDDLSLFLMEIERHFGIDATQKEWLGIGGTMEDIASLVLKHLSQRGCKSE